MSILKRSLIYSFAGKYTTLIIDLISVMIVSRLLTPAELGAYSLAAGSIAIGQVLRDFGLSLYIMKEKDLDDGKIQSCFTISLVLCWSIALIYFLSAENIGRYLENDEITTLIKILSLNFLIIPFGTLILSILKRNMKFEKIMLADISSTVARVALTLILIYQGWGITAMALGAIAGTLATVVIAMLHAEWKYYRFNFQHIKEIGRFTSFVSLSNILSQARGLIPEFIIAKNLSSEHVAYFGKATSTLSLFTTLILSAVTPVIQPYIASINNKKEQLDESIYTIMTHILVLQWPFCVFVFLFSGDLINILYGPQWTEAIPLTKIFAILLFLDGLVTASDQLLNAIGKVKLVFNYSIIMTAGRIILIYTFIDQGLVIAAQSLLILGMIKLFILFPVFKNSFSLTFSGLLRVYTSNLLIAGVTAILGVIALELFSHLETLFRFLSTITLLGVGWILSVYIFKHEVREHITKSIIMIKSKVVDS